MSVETYTVELRVDAYRFVSVQATSEQEAMDLAIKEPDILNTGDWIINDIKIEGAQIEED